VSVADLTLIVATTLTLATLIESQVFILFVHVLVPSCSVPSYDTLDTNATISFGDLGKGTVLRLEYLHSHGVYRKEESYQEQPRSCF
jgi:hypothetical protein